MTIVSWRKVREGIDMVKRIRSQLCKRCFDGERKQYGEYKFIKNN